MRILLSGLIVADEGPCIIPYTDVSHFAGLTGCGVGDKCNHKLCQTVSAMISISSGGPFGLHSEVLQPSSSIKYLTSAQAQDFVGRRGGVDCAAGYGASVADFADPA